MPVGFHLVIDGAFTMDQMQTIATESGLTVHNDMIDFGSVQARLSNGRLRLFTSGADQSEEDHSWFDSAAAMEHFLYMATNPEKTQILGRLLASMTGPLADISEAAFHIRNQGADLLIGSRLRFTEQSSVDMLRQALRLPIPDTNDNLLSKTKPSKNFSDSIIETTHILDFLRPIWATREIGSEGNMITIELTWPAADISDLVDAAFTLRPAWETHLTNAGAVTNLHTEARRIVTTQTQSD